MLPAVMRWNRAADKGQQAMVAAAMNRPQEQAGNLLDALIAELGMPRSLSAVGIGPEHFEHIAEQAMATPWVPRNPRRIDGPAQVREILELAA
jgi:maleylacetate reductase